MTYPEAIQFLYGLRWYGAKLGLDNTFKLAALAGNPHRSLRFIHVAGTNGKGSVCAMLESIYRAAGLRVGLFTSPHLVAFNERIQVDRVPIPEREVAGICGELQPLLSEFDPEHHPTFFEVVTVLALLYFQRQQCDLVVWETGLGGRLDATNIVTPLASVITNIQFDHQKHLGETLGSIAFEKAGIIKPGVPVITGVVTPEPLEVIVRTAQEKGCALTRVPRLDTPAPPLNTVHLPLLGRHQLHNAAVAVESVRVLQPVLPVPDAQMREGLSSVHWPGRLQLVLRNSGQKVLLDGAHNPAGTASLADALKDYFPGVRPALVLGILRDKDWPAMCQMLAPLARRILLVPVHSERTAEPHGLAEVCHAANPDAPIFECQTLAEAFEQCENEPFVTVAGSLYLIGETMEFLRLSASPSGPGDSTERLLNEWQTPSPPDSRK